MGARDDREEPWYSKQRRRWRPDRVRLLLVAESAPDDGGDASRRRFFYAEKLTRDNLFRGVVHAMYGLESLAPRSAEKPELLRRLRDDGIYLIDLAPYPVNKIMGAELKAVLAANVAGCVERAVAADPEGVIIIKKDLFPLLQGPLQLAGLQVLHEQGISFPLGNTRQEFVRDFRAAVTRLDHRGEAPQ